MPNTERVLRNKVNQLYRKEIKGDDHERVINEKKTNNAIKIGQVLIELEQIIEERKLDWNQYIVDELEIKPFQVSAYMKLAKANIPVSYHFLGIQKLRSLIRRKILNGGD